MKLKVMTYNVAGCRSFEFGPDYRPIIHAEQKYAETIGAFAPDICGLNEIDYKLPRSGRVKMAQFLGDAIGYESAFAPAVTFINKYGAGTYGNGMITKHKILEAETYPIPDPVERNEDTYYESRAVLRAVIEIEGKKVDVLVTHFGLATDEKINAVKTLVPLIKYAENPVILMGDFNILDTDPVLAPIQELLDDTFAVYPDKENVVTCPSSAEFWPNDNYHKIDYIFVSRGIKIEKVEIPELVLSDHKPYIAYIEIPD